MYAGILGGIHYHRHFERKFDTVLKKQMLDVVHRRSEIMIGGLVSRPQAITIKEYDVLKNATESYLPDVVIDEVQERFLYEMPEDHPEWVAARERYVSKRLTARE